MFDVVVHDDRPWLVMEYLPSRLAGHRASGRRARCCRVQVAAIGRDVADGLAAAHVAGVVHRDVKPGNVLIGTDGRVKLTDFGVSRAVDDVQLTRTGLIAGTPAFLAPEIAQGRTPTAASDVFALGATLYAAVEGAPPFGLDDNAYALLHKVATAAPNPPQHAGPLTPVLMRLLAVDPAARPVGVAGPRPARRGGGGRGRAGGARRRRARGDRRRRARRGPSTRPDLVPPRRAPAPARPPRRRAPMLVGALRGAAGHRRRSHRARAGPQRRRAGPRPTATAPPPGGARAAAAPTTAAPTTAAAATRHPRRPSPAATGQTRSRSSSATTALLPGDPDAAFALLGPDRAEPVGRPGRPSRASTGPVRR